MIFRNLTPKHLQCSYGACPAVYELEDGRLVVIGDKTEQPVSDLLKEKVAQHEDMVVIRPEFLSSIIKAQKKKA